MTHSLQRFFLALTFPTLFFSMACKTHQQTMKPSPTLHSQDHGPVNVRDVAHSNRCGVQEPQQLLISSQAEWEQLWAQVTSREIPPLPVPAVDFTKECIVACFLGAKSTGGFSLSITGIQQKDGVLTVAVEDVSPGKGCMVTEAFTYPHHIVAIPRGGVEKATFTTTHKESSCK